MYNIAIVGKTGSGKSTLLNYLFRKRLARTGAGRPVTERGFHPYPFSINGLPVCVYDSWGLEADKADAWMQELETELRKRGVDKSAPHWFHTILYCVNAGGHRVEPYDIRIIRKFLTSRYKVTVILTKADLAHETQREEMASAIHSGAGTLPVIAVCAEEKDLKSGVRVRPFGRTEIFAQITADLWESICLRLPQRCLSVLKQTIESWRYRQLALLETAPRNRQEQARRQAAASIVEFVTGIETGLFEQLIRTELENTFSMYRQFRQVLVEIPEVRQVSADKSMSDKNPALLGKYPLLAGPIIGPIAYLTARTLGEKKKHHNFIEAVNKYFDQLRAEADKLEPAVSEALNQLRHQFRRDFQN